MWAALIFSLLGRGRKGIFLLVFKTFQIQRTLGIAQEQALIKSLLSSWNVAGRRLKEIDEFSKVLRQKRREK